MTRKKVLLKIIADSIRELSELQGDDGATLFVNGDNEQAEVTMVNQGSVNVLNEAICQRLQLHEPFRRLWLGMTGAFLTNNKDAKDLFLLGLEESNHSFGVN